jgi:hypothetical protein
MVMAQELYTLLTPTPFCLPNNPGNATVNVCPTLAGQPVDNTPLMPTEQATINTRFACKKQYFLSLQNIKRVCFTALNTIVNNAFKASNNPTIQGWHTGMRVINILDQLSTIYGQPMPTCVETNDAFFATPTQPWMPPKYSSVVLKNALRRHSWDTTCTQIGSLSQMPFVSSSSPGCTSSNSRNGIV